MAAHSAVSLRLNRVAFSYDDARPIIHPFDLHLNAGFAGLVGANGAGKTTLLRLIGGELAATAGSIRVEPCDAAFHLCPQAVDECDAAIEAFAWAFDPPAIALYDRLRLRIEQLERWATLSPGERKRWQIGAALHARPRVLLLDEPTNHLDEESRRWLLAALREFAGVGIVVSHDRAFLDALTRATIRIVRGHVEHLDLPFEAAREAWSQDEQAQRREADTARAQLRRLAARADERERRRARIETRGRTSKRVKGPKDRDGRSMAAKYRVAVAERAAAREVRRIRTRVEQARARVPTAPRGASGGDLWVDWEPHPTTHVFSVDPKDVAVAGRALAGPERLWVGRDERVWIRGPNGAGKTTLLRALVRSSVHGERIFSLPQALSVEDRQRALADTLACAPQVRGRILSIVARLGTDPKGLLATRCPSPGEARKLLIAAGLARSCWALVLDEPTNHLDIDSIARLEAALADYPGAIVIVTHDAALGRNLGARTWTLDEEREVVTGA